MKSRKPPLEMPRRLALVVPPVPGESLTSWLDAIARDHGFSRRWLLKDAFKIHRSPDYTWRLTRELSEDASARIRIGTGISSEALHRLLLPRYLGSGIPGLSASQWDERVTREFWSRWSRTEHSPWCPACVRENDGRWLLSWKTSWSYACTRHGVFLVARCPACGSAQDKHNSPATLRTHCPDPQPQKVGERGRKPCGRPLTDAPAQPVSDQRLLEVQTWIDQWIGGTPNPMPGHPCSTQYFSGLVALVLRLASPAMLGQADPAVAQAVNARTEFWQWTSALEGITDSLKMAGAVYLADQLLNSPNRRETITEFATLASDRVSGYRLEPIKIRYDQAERTPWWIVEHLERSGVITLSDMWAPGFL